MARKPATERKTIHVREVRIPWKSLLHGKTPREAIDALEEWRRQFNEDEILYKRTVKIKWDPWGTSVAVVERQETDAEYKKRRDAAEAAKIKRAENARLKAQKEAEVKQAKEKLVDKFASMTFAEYMQKAGISTSDLLNEMRLDYEDLKKLDKL